MAGGTAEKLTSATIVVAGVAAIIATLLSIVSIFLQLKNYRKPLLQRYVVRILLMVPIYSIASWTSMVSLVTAQFLDPIRDIYEAFTIYTFFQLLINYLEGERALIIMTHGREPVNHLWPMNHCMSRVDISDPHTFLAIKRGILQYAWLKPVLGIATIIMKATGTYQEGYIGLNSGYLWSGIIYNISMSVSLYSLALFWVCMHHDLLPFRPIPKFLCIKLIIFASYWQGFFLSILVWLGAIPSGVEGYTPDNLAAAIQDALICVEMPGFAIAHWYAFSWHDFADNSILSARMPVYYAFRDAFGIRDLIEDSKQTFTGDQYGYRVFDSGDKVMAHEASDSRLSRLKEGMRYTQGGKAKYWIPTPGQVDHHANRQVDERDPLLAGNAGGPSNEEYNAANGTFEDTNLPDMDKEEEHLYVKARELEFGDWNYPVITASEPLRNRYMSSTSSFGISSPSTAGKPKQKQKQNQARAEPALVVSKKKRKQKDIPKTEVGGETSKSLVDEVPPKVVAEQPRATSSASGRESSDSDQENDVGSRYQVGDEDEFRNVWSSGDQPR